MDKLLPGKKKKRRRRRRKALSSSLSLSFSSSQKVDVELLPPSLLKALLARLGGWWLGYGVVCICMPGKFADDGRNGKNFVSFSFPRSGDRQIDRNAIFANMSQAAC